MAWTTPHVFVVGEMLTAAQMNAIGSDLSFLKAGVSLLSTTLTSVGPTSATTELVLSTSPAFAADGATTVEIMFSWYNIVMTVGGDVFLVRLYDGVTPGSGTQLAQNLLNLVVNGGSGVCRAVVTPSAGSHTYTARLVRSAGTGTATMAAVSGTVPGSYLSIAQVN